MVSASLDMWDLINGHQMSEALHVPTRGRILDHRGTAGT
jgi:hypothetical protein